MQPPASSDEHYNLLDLFSQTDMLKRGVLQDSFDIKFKLRNKVN